MGDDKFITFHPFRLDLANQCLWRDSQAIKLRPKAFAVLYHIIARPRQLVTKEELLNAVWPETFVGEAVLKVTIRQLREALGDDPKSARFIETAHRRGYRFIGDVTEGALTPEGAGRGGGRNVATAASSGVAASHPCVVGRDEALSRMRAWSEKMLGGERQVVFVAGEAGIGKTALVDTFARGLPPDRGIRVVRGQCLEHYGTGEAYLPVLEAVGRLCREQPQAVDVLRFHAPLWLLQMPSLLGASDREALGREVLGATRERMLREMGGALGALAAEGPLVLILEDLHWSDYSTLDLISYLARQREAARLMLVGTYRTVELIVSGHPLKAVKRELLAKRQCEELPLEYLGREAVAGYLSARFPGHRFPAALAGLIHERTEGHPLFMVNVADYLVAEGLLREGGAGWEFAGEIESVEPGVPDGIKQMIEKQIEHLGEAEQRTLEAASVAGAEFSAAAVAAGLAEDGAAVEARCDELARRHQFIRDCGMHVLPNGDAAGRYGFIHALYRHVLYGRLPASGRVQLHRRIGERGEEVYGERAGEIAAELAAHFERGRDHKRAARYLHQVADKAVRRFAYREAVTLSRRGLDLLRTLPDTPERARQELCLQFTLGVPLIATEGYAVRDVGGTYRRARELCQQLGDTENLSEALYGLWTFYTLRAELGTAREIAEELLRSAEPPAHAGLALRSHLTMGVNLVHMGEFTQSLEHFERVYSLYDPERHGDDAFLYTQNPGVASRCHASWAHWFLGRPDQALSLNQEALTLARELSEPHGLAHAHFFAAILHQFRREVRKAQEHAEAANAVSREHGLAMYQAHSAIIRGWTLIGRGHGEEAIEQMRKGLAAQRATAAESDRPHFMGLLAEGLGMARRPEEGLRALEEALEMAKRNGERYYEAELYRLKGEVLLLQTTGRGMSGATTGGKAAVEHEPGGVTQAETCFRQAIKIAKQQKAKSFELRAAMSLARLNRNRGRYKEARALLTQVYDGFTEGFDTADLREARALLAGS